MNLYEYANGDPVNNVDPSGLYPSDGDLAAQFGLGDAKGLGQAALDFGSTLNPIFGVLLDPARALLSSSCGSEAEQNGNTFGGILGFVRSLFTGEGEANVAAKAGAEGGNLVYQSTNAAGKVNYVGITNSLEPRAAEHWRSKGIIIDAIPGLTNLSRADARAVEQALIKEIGLSKNGGNLMNKINSIAAPNPIYEDAVARGRALLHRVGYAGF